MRIITIHPALNGYICQVGCQTIVMGSKEALLSNLKDYLDNPDRIEREYIKNAVNRTKGLEGDCVANEAPRNATCATEAQYGIPAPTPTLNSLLR